MAKPKSMCDLADHLVAEVTDARGVFRWCFACGAGSRSAASSAEGRARRPRASVTPRGPGTRSAPP